MTTGDDDGFGGLLLFWLYISHSASVPFDDPCLTAAFFAAGHYKYTFLFTTDDSAPCVETKSDVNKAGYVPHVARTTRVAAVG